LSLDRVNANRNFGNKLWNAGKFILFQLDQVNDEEWQQLSVADLSSSSSWQDLCLSDRWILSSLHQVGPAVYKRVLVHHLGWAVAAWHA